MGIPLHFGRWKRKQSLALLIVLPVCTTLWAATIVSWRGVHWEWAQMGLAALVLVVGWDVLRNGLASLFLAMRLTQDTLVALAAATGFCFGFLVCVLQSTGFLGRAVHDGGSLAGPFFAASATVVAVRLLNGYLRNRMRPANPWDDGFPNEPLHRLLRPALFCGFLFGLAVTVPQAWPVAGIPGVVALTLTLLAALSPEAFHLTKGALRRWTDISIPGGPSDAVLSQLARIDTIVIEKSQVLTQGACELRNVITLDPGTCEEEILHFAAIAEFLLPPNAIRSAVLNGARDAVRTVPTLKGYQHMPGRGVSARYRSQQLLFGNLEWLRDKGHSQEEIAELREETRALYERGETVLYVSLAGKVLGAIGLYDPPRPEIDGFVRQLKSLDVKVSVATGDTPETVRGLLKDYPEIEVVAGLRPQELVDRLREREELGDSVALVSKKDSVLATSAKPVTGTVFRFNRKSGFTAVTSSREPPLDLQGGTLDRISRLLHLARRLVATERIRVRVLTAYHLLFLPAVLSLIVYFISWKFYGLVGILMGAVIPTLVVPSDRALGDALIGRPSAGDPETGAESDQTDARPKSAEAQSEADRENASAR